MAQGRLGKALKNGYTNSLGVPYTTLYKTRDFFTDPTASRIVWRRLGKGLEKAREKARKKVRKMPGTRLGTRLGKCVREAWQSL